MHRRRRMLHLSNFNSRPREGANFIPKRSISAAFYFNSRPREGANQETRLSWCVLSISIPAPARGRTKAVKK